MKNWMFFCIVAIIAIVLLILIAYISSLIHQFQNKFEQRRMKAKLRRRYPYLPIKNFALIAKPISPCCKTIMWGYDNLVIRSYFCDSCGKRYKEEYDFETKEYTGKLEHLQYELDLSDLNEFWSTINR